MLEYPLRDSCSAPSRVAFPLQVTYANYDAFNDKDNRWHPLLNETLFAAPVPIVCHSPPSEDTTVLCDSGGSAGRWVLQSAKYVWTPHACHYHVLAPPEIGKCLARKRLLFVGDSQMRATFIAFITRVYNAVHTTPQVLSPDTPRVQRSLCPAITS